MTLQYETFTSKEAAQILGVTDARVRQLCISYENIGKKHGNAWIISSEDISKIRSLPEFRKKTA